MNYFGIYSQTLFDRLQAAVATNHRQEIVPVQSALDSWCRLSGEAQARGKTHWFIGNGASAMMAGHMALDAAKNGGISAMAFNDAATLTAVGNDLDFKNSFAAPLGWHAKAGDVLVAISSSGRSSNIVAGVAQGRKLGCAIVTLTGMHPDNPVRAGGDLNFFVPGKTYGCVECLHQILLHCWLDQFMDLKEWEPAH